VQHRATRRATCCEKDVKQTGMVYHDVNAD